MALKTEVVNIKVSKQLKQQVIDELVKAGTFLNASEAWRYAMKFYLDWKKVDFSIRQLFQDFIEYYQTGELIRLRKIE